MARLPFMPDLLLSPVEENSRTAYIFSIWGGRPMANDLLIERHGHVNKIVFNRPAKKNALTRAMFRGLVEAIEEADRSRSVNAILLCGSSGTFSAGTDIPDFLTEVHAGP